MVKRISVQNFMGYSNFKSHEFAPINLIIGKNDTGKTGLLKLLYSCCKAVDIYSRRVVNEEVLFKRVLAEKLLDTFQPGKRGLGELVSKITHEKLHVDIEYQQERLGYFDRMYFSFGESTTSTINDCQETIGHLREDFRCLFLPAKEVLTSFKAIRATRDNLHIPGFDDTYLDLIRALVVPTQRGNYTSGLKSVNRKLEDLFDGRIEQGVDDDFVFKKGKNEFSMAMTSEGVKKIGILTTLIRNRQINDTSLLFMDEPETTLHPEAIRELMGMLMLMAKSGVQVFLASHSYFVLKQLHLSARKENINVGCYALTRERNQPIRYDYFNLREDLPDNAISDEAIRMSDEEVRLDLNL